MIDVEKIELKLFDKNHLNDPCYIEWLNDFEVVKYLGRPEYFSKVSFTDLEEYYSAIVDNKNIYFFAVYYVPQNKFIGTAKINLSDSYNNVYDIADIGVMIGDKSFWRMGLSSEILLQVSIYAFNDLAVRKLSAGAISENIAVIRAFEKIGFKTEGILKQKIFFENRYLDHILMGCFKEDIINPQNIKLSGRKD